MNGSHPLPPLSPTAAWPAHPYTLCTHSLSTAPSPEHTPHSAYTFYLQLHGLHDAAGRGDVADLVPDGGEGGERWIGRGRGEEGLHLRTDTAVEKLTTDRIFLLLQICLPTVPPSPLPPLSPPPSSSLHALPEALQPPRLGRLIDGAHDVGVECLPLLKGLVQGDLAQLRALQGGWEGSMGGGRAARQGGKGGGG